MAEFGGAWTTEKLIRVEAYLNAFIKVMKNQRSHFRLIYADAFSGGPALGLRGGGELPLLEQGRVFTAGSARRALAINPAFDAYHFIDLSPTSLSELKQHIEASHQPLISRCELHQQDVNVALPALAASLNRKTDRAVVFLDPFGMQVNWDTMEALGAAVVDLWYLVPTMAINRLLTKDRQRLEQEGWATRLDDFLGSQNWRTRWYEETQSTDLFGGIDQRFTKTATIDRIETDFCERMKMAGFMMAPNRLRLLDGPRHLFTLVFGCSNPSPKAFSPAVRIADHLLKD
jgi:three-Cys-motif partner protein